MNEQKCTAKNTICFILKLLLINLLVHACVYGIVKLIKKHKGFQCCGHKIECNCGCHCGETCDCDDECDCEDGCSCDDDCDCDDECDCNDEKCDCGCEKAQPETEKPE